MSAHKRMDAMVSPPIFLLVETISARVVSGLSIIVSEDSLGPFTE